jgi:hypothetical protein
MIWPERWPRITGTADKVHDAVEIGVDLRPEFCVLSLLEGDDMAKAGIIDENVEAAEGADCKFHPGLCGGGVGDVEREGPQIIAMTFLEIRHAGRIARGRHDAVAGGERRLRNGAPEPPSTAGD